MQVRLLAFISLVLAGWALKETSTVTMPLAFAFFVAVLLQPLYEWLKKRIPRGLALAVAMLALLVVLALLAGAVWLGISPMVQQAPQYTEQIEKSWQDVTNWAQRHNLPIPQSATGSDGLSSRLGSIAGRFVMSLWTGLGLATLVFFLTLLILLESSSWAERTRKAWRGERAARILDSAAAVGRKVRQYIAIHTVLSMIAGVTEGLFLWIIGVDFAFFWGFLLFVLNYIPNIGSVIAGLPPMLLAFMQGGWQLGLIAGIGLMALDNAVGYVIQPIFEGKKLVISPIVVLMSVIFWTWAWGVPGAFLAAPLTAAMLIVFAHIDGLRPWALLLSRASSPRALFEETHEDPSLARKSNAQE